MYIDDPADPSIGKEEGPKHGQLVRYHEGSFIEIGPNDPSHNAVHHQQFTTVDATRDEAQVRQAAEAAGLDPESQMDLVNAGAGENMHHFEVQEDDPNYDPDSPTKMTARQLPDSVAPTVTSHTDAWKE